MADHNMNDADNNSDDDSMDEDDRAAIEAAMQLQLAAHQPVPRQLPPPPQVKLLQKLADQIQKKDEDKTKGTQPTEEGEEVEEDGN